MVPHGPPGALWVVRGQEEFGRAHIVAGPQPGVPVRRRVGMGGRRKRAGGAGLISGRKAFQRPMNEGVELLHAIQDVYLSPEVTIA